eukprot:s570_g18.t2
MSMRGVTRGKDQRRLSEGSIHKVREESAAHPQNQTMLATAWDPGSLDPTVTEIESLAPPRDTRTGNTRRVQTVGLGAFAGVGMPRHPEPYTVEKDGRCADLCNHTRRKRMRVLLACVTDLVRQTLQCWEKESLNTFFTELQQTNTLPYSRRLNWALILLLAKAEGTICLKGHETYLRQAKDALVDQPTQPAAIQKRIAEAKQAWKLLASRGAIPGMPVTAVSPQVLQPEAPARRVTGKTRPQPQPKGRTAPPVTVSRLTDLQGTWLHSSFGEIKVEGTLVTIGQRRFHLIQKPDCFVCGGYGTRHWTPVMPGTSVAFCGWSHSKGPCHVASAVYRGSR